MSVCLFVCAVKDKSNDVGSHQGCLMKNSLPLFSVVAFVLSCQVESVLSQLVTLCHGTPSYVGGEL